MPRSLTKEQQIEMQKTKRLLGRHFDRWRCVGREIVDEKTGAYVGIMYEADVAWLVASAHNLFLPMANTIGEFIKKLGDRYYAPSVKKARTKSPSRRRKS